MATTAGHAPATQGGEEHGGGKHMNPALISMLLFIGSELMLFASLFTAYFFIRFGVANETWPPLKQDGEPFTLPIILTAVNTALLVFSSFTLWWGEKRLAAGDNKGLIRGLWVTVLLGGTFLIIQLNEYAHLGFTPQDKAFSGAFYTLTGFHGMHVLVGVILLALCLKRAYQNDFSASYHTPLTASSYYWHFVDVVWVLLFILVYLV